MPSPAEIAKEIVAEWFKWADRGMFIGHCDKKALTRLEAAIAAKIEQAVAEATKPHPTQFLDRQADRPVPVSGPPADKPMRRVRASKGDTA